MSLDTVTTQETEHIGVPGDDVPLPKEDWFLEPFNAGDVDGVMRFYAPDVVYPTPSGGTAALRDLVAELIKSKFTMHGQTTATVCHGDLALMSFRWTLAGTSPAGEPVEQNGTAALVLRRQSEGGWLVVLENPFNP